MIDFTFLGVIIVYNSQEVPMDFFKKYQDVLTIIFFGLLLIIFGRVKILIPGSLGIVSNFTEVAVLLSLPFIKNWKHAAIIGLFTVFNVDENGNYFSDTYNHVVGMVFLFFAYQRNSKIENMIHYVLSWIITIFVYYYLILIPLIFIYHYLTSAITFNEMISNYWYIGKYVVFEFVSTLLIGNFYFILRKETQKKQEALANIVSVTEDNNKKLEILVEEKTKELYLAMNKIFDQENQKTLNTLVAGVAHEINTPLGVSISAASFLNIKQQEFFKWINEALGDDNRYNTIADEIHKTTELLENNLNRVARLVNTFKKIAVDQNVEHKTEFYIDLLIGDILSSLKVQSKERGITFVVNCPKDYKAVIYPTALAQILMSLIDNSIQHGFDGKESGEININVLDENSTIKIVIADNGVGIKEEILNRIYDPFFTTNRKFGGHGLGLHIVKSMVMSKFNGTIQCESTLGTGTRFTIELQKS